MKIAWFTPFLQVSAIGKFSQAVTDCLARTAQVDLWLPEEDGEPLHETALRIVRFPRIRNYEQFLREYDLVVYNLGDQARNHGAIYEASRLYPGLVILHDYVMHHFFATYYDSSNAWDIYADAMSQWYGADIRLTPEGWTGDLWRVWERDQVIDYPLFEQAIVGCKAVVTHSSFFRQAVARVAAVPVASIPLAYAIDRDAALLTRAELGIPADRTLIVTTGHVNQNKRVQSMLQVLAPNRDLAKQAVYVVVGQCSGPFGEALASQVREGNLQETVRFTGYADFKVLRSYLVHADFCVNLRWPAMEGGSASCAEQMLYGKASIVTDTGVYSDLPEDCVRKVRPAHELDDLARYVRQLSRDSDLCREMGNRARKFAEENHNPAVYARRLLDFFAELSYFEPAFRLMDKVGSELKSFGVTPEMAIVDTIASESAMLLDGDYNPPILREGS